MKTPFVLIVLFLLLSPVMTTAQVDADSAQQDMEELQVPPLEQEKQEQAAETPAQESVSTPQQQLPAAQSNVVQPVQRTVQNPASSRQEQQQQPVRQQIQSSPLMEERPVTSAPTNVKMATPVISIDLIMDLYNKDIDFDIEYSGTAAAGASNLGKKRPSEQEVQKMVTEQMDTTASGTKNGKDKKTGKPVPTREDGTKPYTPEDANYNKAMISLNNAQQLFASRRYTEAMAEINRSITYAPNIALAYSVKGSIHYMLRQVTEAKRSWERALELDPTLDNVRAILLRMY